MRAMYLDALEFLEEERDAWAPYEALSGLTDDQLEQPVEAAHGWSGRDLMAHMLAWQGIALEIAQELAVNETSPTIARVDAEWDAKGDVFNDEIQADVGGAADGRHPRVLADAAGRTAGLPDGRARDALGQARRASQDVPRRDDRPLRGTRAGAGGGARGGSGVTLESDGGLTLTDVLAEAAEAWRACQPRWNRRAACCGIAPAGHSPRSVRMVRRPSSGSTGPWPTPPGGRPTPAPRVEARTGSEFSPAELDDHALDRAEAWFGSAWRRAERP